jgi:hypothetical protein
MKWSEVRRHFPECCVLVEALKSETRGKERVIEEMSVIDDFENGYAAWKVYKKTACGKSKPRIIFLSHE